MAHSRGAWYLLPVVAVILLLHAFAGTAFADNPPNQTMDGVRFDQKLNAQVPLDLAFTDDEGNPVKLGDYFRSKPIVLTLNYYHCPNLCSLEMDQLAGSMADLQWNLGDEYEVVTVSIDPRESPAQAAESKWERLRAYARANTGPGWHFLVGSQASVTALTEAVGFHYVYDAKNDEFEHPTGVMVLTPQGRISRYLYGTDFPSTDLKLALIEASANKIGSPVEQLLLYCYTYDPAKGRYSLTILNATRVAGIGTILVLGGWLFTWWRRDLRRDKQWLENEKKNKDEL